MSAATAPPGYTIVRGSAQMASSSALASGSDTLCPSGTVAWGGGVAWHGLTQIGETIGTTDPAGSAGWNTLVGNATGGTEDFNVDAICAAKPVGYTVVSKSRANPAGAQSSASVTCPANTVVLSAGILSESDSSAVGLTSLWPKGRTTVTGREFNGSAAATTMQVEAVCGQKPAKYTIVRSKTSLPADTGTFDTPVCPTGTSLIGEGVKAPAAAGAKFAISALTDDGAGGEYLTVVNLTTSTVTYFVDEICAA